MGAPATGSGNPRMLRSIVTYISHLHINSGIERNGGRSHVGTTAPPRLSRRAQRAWVFVCPSSHSRAERGLRPAWTAGGGCPYAVRSGWRKPLEVGGQKRGVAMGG